MTDKTFSELEAQADAMVRWLETQLHAAQAQCTMLVGQVAILEKKLASIKPPPPSELPTPDAVES